MSDRHADLAHQAMPVEPTFLVAFCTGCAREVLTVRELGEAGDLLDVCMHCHEQVSAETASARWLEARELLELGYFVDGVEPEKHGHEGGCRGGQCGISQPAAHASGTS